jgi:positive regulator of sigma E activity
MANIKKSDFLPLIMQILILIIPQIIGVLFMDWNWAEAVVLYVIEIFIWWVIDLTIVLTKSRELVDYVARSEVKQLDHNETSTHFWLEKTDEPVGADNIRKVKMQLSGKSLIFAGILVFFLIFIYIALRFLGSETLLSAFTSLNYVQIAIIGMIFFVLRLTMSIMRNHGRKLSEIDSRIPIESGVLVMMFAGLFLGFVGIPLNLLNYEYSIWIILLVMQVIVGIIVCWASNRKEPANC